MLQLISNDVSCDLGIFALMKICVTCNDGTIYKCALSFKPLSKISGVLKAKLMGVCFVHVIAPDCYKKLSSKKIKIYYCSCSQFCFPSPFNLDMVRFPLKIKRILLC